MHLFGLYFVDVFRNHYLTSNGRARRTEFTVFYLSVLGISAAIHFGLGMLSESWGLIAGVLFGLVTILPLIGTTVRRFQDLGMSGWFFLALAIPLVGYGLLLYLMIKEGEEGPNRFGPDPKAPHKRQYEIHDFGQVLGR